MQAIVLPDTRRINVVYDKGLTAVNAPNVEHQSQVQMMQPFQPSSRYPIGQPPVRYPDVTTTPGFMDNPAEDDMDARNVAERMADSYNHNDPMPIRTDNFDVYGTSFQTARPDISSGFHRLFGANNSFPLTGWNKDSQYFKPA